jgi:hypothetical protein
MRPRYAVFPQRMTRGSLYRGRGITHCNAHLSCSSQTLLNQSLFSCTNVRFARAAPAQLISLVLFVGQFSIGWFLFDAWLQEQRLSVVRGRPSSRTTASRQQRASPVLHRMLKSRDKYAVARDYCELQQPAIVPRGAHVICRRSSSTRDENSFGCLVVPKITKSGR